MEFQNVKVHSIKQQVLNYLIKYDVLGMFSHRDTQAKTKTTKQKTTIFFQTWTAARFAPKKIKRLLYIE